MQQTGFVVYREAKTWPADRVDRYWNEVLEHDMLEQEAACNAHFHAALSSSCLRIQVETRLWSKDYFDHVGLSANDFGFSADGAPCCTVERPRG